MPKGVQTLAGSGSAAAKGWPQQCQRLRSGDRASDGDFHEASEPTFVDDGRSGRTFRSSDGGSVPHVRVHAGGPEGRFRSAGDLTPRERRLMQTTTFTRLIYPTRSGACRVRTQRGDSRPQSRERQASLKLDTSDEQSHRCTWNRVHTYPSESLLSRNGTRPVANRPSNGQHMV